MPKTSKIMQDLLEAKNPADYEKARQRAVGHAVKIAFVAGFQVGTAARRRIEKAYAARQSRRKRLTAAGGKGAGRGGAGRG